MVLYKLEAVLCTIMCNMWFMKMLLCVISKVSTRSHTLPGASSTVSPAKAPLPSLVVRNRLPLGLLECRCPRQ